ncbi:zinc finger SWIM domain-containing protein 7-like [Neocloeon triangulifer]|uniref:zinc finger SWIM domain-containing protein 7-like n=1 Tax=Neocloeon triangulifer TaxID=2078957 RepID=UPI00286F6757|nr:zinc finger SWIM domain-containing protein 7-like [Neocloeon triangulifer]
MSLRSVLSNLSKDIFKEVEAIVVDEGKLTDEAMLALNSVFGAVLERALAIVDKPNSVCELQSPIGRKLVQVSGTSKGVYTLYPEENYCPCPAFQFYVLGANASEMTCKHVLAAWLARILGKARLLTIGEETMTSLLTSLLTEGTKDS